MTRIGLLNLYSPDNIGDAAIYSAYAQILYGTRIVADLPESHHAVLPAISRGSVVGTCDAYISVGGDIFNNARPQLVSRRFLENLASLVATPSGRTLLFGQSIPPSCRGMAFFALARVLRGLSSVWVRDSVSHTRLLRAGVAARLTFDTAFGLKRTVAGAAAARELFDAAGIDADRSAFISLRGFSHMYGHRNDDVMQKLQRLARLLAGRGHEPVLLIQSSVDAMDDDRVMSRTLVAAVPTLKILDLTRTRGAEPWDCAAAALAAARIVVAVRYHTAVLRMLSGRSCYSLYYSNKGADLVSRLGQPGNALSEFDPERELAMIERSALACFDIAPVRAQVRSDLRQACRNALVGNALTTRKESVDVA